MVALKVEVLRLIREENIERAKAILEENAYFYDSVSASKYTLLHHCAVYDNAEMVRFLLDKGCHVDPQDSMGRTPLMISVLVRSSKVAYVLLRAGANIDTLLNNRNESVLNLTLSEHAMPVEFVAQLLARFRSQFATSEETAEKLIDAGCHLYQAICLRDVKIIEFMLDRGFEVDSMHPMDEVTALHFAVYFEDVQMVRLLLDKGADALVSDYFGRTPLFYSYYLDTGRHNREKLEILKIFLDLKVPTTTCTFDGIFQAANTLMRGDREVLQLVLQSCLDFTVEEESSGKTMLHYIARNENLGVIEELKRHIGKFNVNAVDKGGRNPLYWAARAGNVDMAEFLLQHGAAINSTRRLVDNLPPLYYAYSMKLDIQSARFIELLLQHGEDAQFIFTKSDGEDITIFDIATEGNDLMRMNIIVAHLAMLEQLGTPITEITRSKIDLQPRSREYFDKCRQVLRTEIWGTVTVFKLLSGDERKIALYLNQKELNLKLKCFCRKLKFSFPYYYNIVRKSLSNGRSHKILKDKVTSILCEIAKNRINVIASRIVGFLNDQDLQNLRRV